MSLGDRVLWRRVKDYVARYQPFLIGVAGVSQVELARQAIACAVGDDRAVAVPTQQRSGHRSVAKGVLGIDEAADVRWWQLLAKSLLREMAEAEPDTIILSLYPHRPGQIDWLVQQLPFQLVVLTDVHSVHLDFFHDRATVAHELASAAAVLPPEGIVVANRDDELVADMTSRIAAQSYGYSLTSPAEVLAERFEARPGGGFAGAVRVHAKTVELHLPQLVGRSQLGSVLAGLQVAHLLGSDLAAAGRRLQNLTLPTRHLVKRQARLLAGQGQATVLDHTAAVAPEAVLQDLTTMQAVVSRAQPPAGTQRAIAVLHELPGLAGMSDRWHRRLGTEAGQAAEIVIGVGQQARSVVAEAATAGADAHHFATTADVTKWLPGMVQRSDIVLLVGGGVTLSRVL